MDAAADDDATLLARTGRGEEAAFNRLVLRHTAFVHRIALRFTQNGADADEITQSVFWTLWTQAAKWDAGRARLRTWLYRVTVNRCIDHGRKARRWRFFASAEVGAVADDGPGADDTAIARSDLAQVRRAIMALPARQRMALLLVAGEELSVPEAAELMETTPRALEQLLVRGRKKLREMTERDER
ncbi:sigma-70 family RNA polymerase sigma factor [Aestuariibius sp. 2305UL40-4]|uniref:sigma-70 family RNA polymerase sigma factor n=1 Tax=Aestuariibius violaceus TaxID=3234132 RepID=UPI00345E876D